jgi:hypothetical protein
MTKVPLWTIALRLDTGLPPEIQTFLGRGNVPESMLSKPTPSARRRNYEASSPASKRSPWPSRMGHRNMSPYSNWRILRVDLATARAQAKGVAPAISNEEGLCPTFTRASKKMATAFTLLDTSPAPSAASVDRLYCQLGEIFTIAAA